MSESWRPLLFYTLTNLQGSQTAKARRAIHKRFTLLLTYKVLKLPMVDTTETPCFTLLLTYKVLKRDETHTYSYAGFTLLLTYKVLKPQIHRGSHRTLRLEIAVSFSFKDKLYTYLCQSNKSFLPAFFL